MNDGFTIKNLIEWLEKQPPEKPYDWTTPSRCLLGQWCGSKGMTGSALRNRSEDLGRDDDFYQIALSGPPYDFGTALRRARAMAHSPAQLGGGE